jgi:hypothetical protein
MSRSTALLPTPLSGAHQAVSTGAASARTAAGVGDQTRAVLISCDEACHYRFGDSASVATSADTYLPASGEHFVRISPGQYVAVIQSSVAGTLHISEMAG